MKNSAIPASTMALRLVMLATLLVIPNLMQAQCNPVGGSAGVIYNATQTDSATFTVTISSTCSIANLGSATFCSFNFPSILAPWSGNTNGSTSTITYSFSSPISSVDLLIGYTGVNGIIATETFLFTTNTGIPSVMVNSGTCAAWTINGNQTTSPSVPGGMNSIHTISSAIPFSDFTITTNSSGTGSGANGGSSFALCNISLTTGLNEPNAGSFSVYPNPSAGFITVSIPEMGASSNGTLLHIYNSQGRLIRTATVTSDHGKQELDLKNVPAGLYYVQLDRNGTTYSKTLMITAD